MKKLISFSAGVTAFFVGVFLMTSSAFAAASVQSVKMSGTNTITITYSQPVYTSATDYTNFTESFGGLTVTSVLGSGTNTIVLVLSGAVASNAAGSLNIGSNVETVSGGGYVTGGTWTIVPLLTVPPTLTSFSMSSNVSDGTFAGTGDIITIMFNLNKAANIQSVTVAGRQAWASGSGLGPYTINYTMQSGDSQQSVPVAITFSDTYGNQSRLNFSYSGSTSGGSNGSSMIASITSNANVSGTLYIGDSITFTVTPNIVQPNARVSGSYNGVPLTWTTSNGGINYTATYVVAYGQANQSYPVQISGVFLTDQYGNVSASAAGYDVQKTINTSVQSQSQGPTISQITPIPSSVTTATPTYIFYSSGSGSILYGGACSSQTTTASGGLNTIVFNALANGTYGDCTIKVINSSGVVGNTLAIPTFTVSGSSTSAATSTSYIDSLTAQLQALQNQLSQIQSGGISGSSSSSSYKFYNPLKYGSEGDEVVELQKRLTAEGVYSGPTNGRYGPLTEAAVKKYQALHGLDQLGNVGPGTRAALNGQ